MMQRSEAGKAGLAALYEMYRNLSVIVHSPLKEITECGEVPETQRGEFEEIKKATGVKSNVEVVRLSIRNCYRERSQLY